MNDLSSSKILIVDDTITNIDVLVEAFGESYDIYFALDGPAALDMVSNDPPDLVLLDVMMPGMDGFEVCRRLKADTMTSGIPVIFMTARSELDKKTEGFSVGAVDYILKPFEILEVRARINTHLMLRRATLELERQNEILEDKVRQRTREITLTQDAAILSLASLAERRDTETGAHIQRTSKYVRALAVQLSTRPRYRDFLDEETIDMMSKSALLHDIGKVGVPDHILMKPGELTSEEEGIMRMHTQYGHDTILAAEKKLGSNSFLRFARQTAYTHHERWDGTGYPQGLKGEEIPLCGRLMTISDVYDALTSKRVYKEAMSHQEAMGVIMKGDGRSMPSHFDPDVL